MRIAHIYDIIGIKYLFDFRLKERGQTVLSPRRAVNINNGQ